MPTHKQIPGKSLFPDIEWSKPENSNNLGKLLIVGGSLHSIMAPSTAFSVATDFGVNNIRVIVPAAAKQNIPTVLPFIEFAPSNPSGSFSKDETNDIKAFAAQSDCAFLCGNFGKNSETALMIEQILTVDGLIVITGDGVDYFTEQPRQLLERPNTIIVASFAQLQKIVKNSPYLEALLFSDGPKQILQKINNFMKEYNSIVITEKDGNIILAEKENIITTNFDSLSANWQLAAACLVSCWSMANKNNLFAASATAIANLA